MDTVYPGISPRLDPGRWISAAGCIFGSHAAGQSSSMGPHDDHGGLLILGKTIWCYNFGVFLIVIVFTSVEIWCYSAVVRYLYRWKAPKWILFGTVLLFAFVPIFGSYAQAVIKDGSHNKCIFPRALYQEEKQKDQRRQD